MTSPTAKTDTTIGKWKKAARLKKVYISDGFPAPTPTPTSEPVPVPAADEYAIVVAESGKWVKMRKEPSTSCSMYDELLIGSKVKVLERGYDWTKISYGHRGGWYMMTKFLDTVGDGEGKY